MLSDLKSNQNVVNCRQANKKRKPASFDHEVHELYLGTTVHCCEQSEFVSEKVLSCIIIVSRDDFGEKYTYDPKDAWIFARGNRAFPANGHLGVSVVDLSFF